MRKINKLKETHMIFNIKQYWIYRSFIDQLISVKNLSVQLYGYGFNYIGTKKVLKRKW